MLNIRAQLCSVLLSAAVQAMIVYLRLSSLQNVFPPWWQLLLVWAHVFQLLDVNTRERKGFLQYYCNTVCPCQDWRPAVQLLSVIVFNGPTPVFTIWEFNPWSLLKKKTKQQNQPTHMEANVHSHSILCPESETNVCLVIQLGAE